jgi:hypothetical protein
MPTLTDEGRPIAADPELPPTYRFRWSNYQLPDYLNEMRQRADNFRREAKILTMRAEQIDEERGKLENALLEVSDANAD